MDRDTFDALVADLDGSMVVVTAALPGERAGCLVGFHSQCGIEPPRYAVWLSKANRTYRVALHATHVAVHLLGPDDHDLAGAFGTRSGDETDTFAGIAAVSGPGGTPLIERCPRRFVLRRLALVDLDADHVLVVGEPVLAESPGPDEGFSPLRLSEVADLDPGHEATDRHLPPTAGA